MQYEKMFDLEMKNDEIDWVPKIICALCRKMLQIGKNGNIEVKMKVPKIWKEPCGKEDCYFCNTNLHGVNRSNKSQINYANVESITKPIYESPIDERKDSEDICTSESMDVEQNLERHDKDEIVEEETEREPEEDVIAEKAKSPDEDSNVASTSDTSDEEYTYVMKSPLFGSQEENP